MVPLWAMEATASCTALSPRYCKTLTARYWSHILSQQDWIILAWVRSWPFWLRQAASCQSLPMIRLPCKDFGSYLRLEGIIPALESAHAVGYACLEPEALGELAIINVSGRGDKDLATVMEYENL